VLVAIAAQQAAKGIGRIRLTRVADASASSLEPATAAAIERGSQVRTDDWRGYSGLDRLGYRRQIVRSGAEVGENLPPHVPPADFVLHNSLFLVAHFHNVIIGGVLFGAFAGYTYWFPKAFGFKLHEGLGKIAFWCWTVGFYVAFMPLYVLGRMGVTRRMQHYDVAGWRRWLSVAAVGAVVILAGIIPQIANSP
jgi:hypothetical protein